MADEAPAAARAAPVPTRKPVAETAAVAAPVVTEQIIQTGEETPQPAEVATAPPVAQAPPSAAPESGAGNNRGHSQPPSAEAPRAFAFAAAMNSARPAPSGDAESGRRGRPTAR